MLKVFKLGKYFANTYEPVIQVIDPRSNVKVASEALDYVKNVKPKEGKTFILVIAMGASEYWGANRNSDGFPEYDLKKNYKNFETTYDSDGKINGGALIYKHHKNKLAKGHPWFGTVTKSFYNEKMHRVELLLELDNEKASDIVTRINNGEYPSVSMGVRIPGDVCSICGKFSAKVEDYCDHLKFSLNKIMPDGKKVYAINGGYDYEKYEKPLNFFDISFVFRPADRTGYMIKKVAEADEVLEGSAVVGDRMERHAQFAEEIKKYSSILKYVRGDVQAVKDDQGHIKMLSQGGKDILNRVANNMTPLTYEKVDNLSKYPLNKVLSTLSANNIILTTPEMIQLMVKKLTGKFIAPSLLQEFVRAQDEQLASLANNADSIEDLEKLDMFTDVEPDPAIEEEINDIKEDRDLSDEGIEKKSHVHFRRSVLDLGGGDPLAHKGEAMTKSEYVTMPNGKKYTASIDAIEEAEFINDITKFMVSGTMATAGAALGTVGLWWSRNNSKLKSAGKSLTMGQKGKPWAALTAGALMGLGSTVMADKAMDYEVEGPALNTDSGKKIPFNTVLIEKQSGAKENMLTVAAPVAGSLALSRFYKNKLKRGEGGYYETTMGKYLDTAGRQAYNHPILTTGGSLLAYGLGRKYIPKALGAGKETLRTLVDKLKK